MLKILHTADWHANYNYGKFYSSYRRILKYIKDNEIDLLVISGDIFDSRVFADKNYNSILNLVAQISAYCPILTIYGTPSHDHKGSLDPLMNMSLDPLMNMRRKYPIMVVEDIKDSFYLLQKNGTITEMFRSTDISDLQLKDSCIFSCLPWPMKYRMLTDEEMKLPLKEQDTIYTEKLNQWLKETKKLKKLGLPTFLVSHLQLNGSMFLKDQDISSDNHDPSMYFDVADYSLLGHIHKHQNIKNLYYSGSIYNKTWNELEDKYFNVWTIEDNKVSVEEVLIKTPKKIKIECTFEEYKEFKTSDTDELSKLLEYGKSYELWFTIEIPNREQLDIEKEKEWWSWYIDGIDIESVRIDLSTIKFETSERAKTFDIKNSLEQKFVNWCKFKNIEPTEFQINKIKELENES